MTASAYDLPDPHLCFGIAWMPFGERTTYALGNAGVVDRAQLQKLDQAGQLLRVSGIGHAAQEEIRQALAAGLALPISAE